ncbi:hypothetical protein PVK06_046990 [Gossypium arboreum]|uniref:Uncharacterized protein n=1 Tax=Gossypium arboreum TaxID=29729 RepID=A0ABR0MC56_GOSAR|nr:hypothetical protein PVK06_046990 [Gossypium arboreum]
MALSPSTMWQSVGDFGCFNNYTIRDDVLPMMSINEGTSNLGDVELVPTELEDDDLDGEGLSKDTEKDLQFTAYSPPTYMHNVDLSAENGLEFAKLLHRRPGHASSSLDSSDLEVRKEFSSKYGFVAAMKQYNIKNGVNFNIVKSQSDKFEVKYFTGSLRSGFGDDRKHNTTYCKRRIVQRFIEMVSSTGNICFRLCNRSGNDAYVLQQSVAPWMPSVPSFLFDFQVILTGIPVLEAFGTAHTTGVDDGPASVAPPNLGCLGARITLLVRGGLPLTSFASRYGLLWTSNHGIYSR